MQLILTDFLLIDTIHQQIIYDYQQIYLRMRLNRFLLPLLFAVALLLATAFAQQAAPNLCLPPCATCQNGNATYCITCILGFELIDNYCVLNSCPVLYCQFCNVSNISQCMVCQNNFMLINNTCVCQTTFVPSQIGSPLAQCICPASANNSCVSCDIQGCISCSNSTSCSACGSPYQSNNNGGCVLCDIQNCQTCLVNNFCGSCLGGLQVSINGQCLACNASSPGCVSCTAQGLCICKDGYQRMVTTNGSYCIQCNIPNCNQCSSDNICTSCPTYRYNLVGNQCAYKIMPLVITCANGCLQCTQAGACTACSLPKNPLSCQLRTIPYCSTYQFQSCWNCFRGFTKSSNSLACNYNGNNVYCQQTVPPINCDTCFSFYVPIQGVCTPCNAGPGCNTCDPKNLTSCLNCISGFYLQNGMCFKCPAYSSGCKGEFSYASKIFMPGVMFTVYTNNRYALVFNPSSCLTFDPTTLFCTSCQMGFYLSAMGACTQCLQSSNCLTCDSNNTQNCLSCNYPDFLPINSSTCVPCRPPCMNCNLSLSVTVCIKCSLGYVLSNGACIANSCGDFSANCMICTGATCLQCLPGYFIGASGNCLPGVPGCNDSFPANPAICMGCYPGTYIDYNSQVCNPCPENCFQCNYINTCLQCLDGYYITGNPQMICAPNCNLPCMGCIMGQPNTCTSCIAGYQFIEGGCVMSNCSLSSSCSYCPLGYGLMSAQTCSKCSINNCAYCNLNSAGCAGCMQGYYLSNQSMTCSPCPQYCQSCLNGVSCILCSSGSTFAFYPLPSQAYQTGQSIKAAVCMPCVSPCATCYGHPQICFSCVEGYVLMGTECMTSTYYYGSISFNSTVSTFLSHYELLVNTILNTAGISGFNNFIPTGLAGQVQYSFVMSILCNNTNKSSCAQNGISNLQALFNNSVVANLAVSSAVFGVESANYSASVPSTASSNCSSPCVTCTVPAGNICLSCPIGYLVKDGTCLNELCPIMYCAMCLSDSLCGQCMPTFSLINNECICQIDFAVDVFNTPNSVCVCTLPNGNCTYCSILNCLQCLNSTFCALCASNYNLTAVGTCYSCSILNCTACSADGTSCIDCFPGYLPQTNTGFCVICNISGCTECQSQDLCSYCQIGYKLITQTQGNVTSTICSLCSIENCMVCNQPNVCSECYFGFTLTNNTCQLSIFACQIPCLVCSTSSPGCQYCMAPPYSLYPDSNGNCYICQTANCMICDSSNPSLCLYCTDGFVLLASGICSSMIACSNYTNTTCTQCQFLYVLGQNNLCVACTVTQGCSQCNVNNISECLSCQYGFFLSNGACNPCPPLCVNCNSTNCVSYSQYVDVINGQLVFAACKPPCICGIQANQANPYYCVNCNAGYYLLNGACYPCLSSSFCSACSQANSSQCLACPNKAYLNPTTQTCQLCDNFCSVCKGANLCSSCVSGYFVQNGTCTPYGNCSTYCYTCGSSGKCLQCYPGYIASGSICLPAIPGCIVHFPSNPSICQVCVPGTILNPLTSTCNQCPFYCYSCTLSSVCTKCLFGFYLTGDNSIPCAPQCQYPCLSCSYTDPTMCFSCASGYSFDVAAPNRCLPQTDCSQGCVTCPASYMLTNASICQACNSTCLTCSLTQPNMCTSCFPGLYVNDNGQCVQCMAGCTQCYNGLLCLQCSPGYVEIWNFDQYFSQPSVTSCVPCQSPCQTCFTRPNYCLTCIDGFTYRAGKCLNNNNYQILIIFLTQLNTFLQNYGNFTQGIVNSVNSSDYGVLIPTLLVGSQSMSTVIYSFFVSSQCLPGTICSQNEISSLNNYLNASTILGMTVLTFNQSLSFNSSANNNTNNTGNNTCIPNCQTCNSTTGACLNCSVGYSTFQGICLPSNCMIPFCKKCSSNNVCQQCNSNFILTNNSCVCQSGWFPNSTNSLTASCICSPSQGSNPAVNLCTKCNVTNCLQCSSATFCNICASPYTLNSNGVCVLCNIPDCGICSSDNFCSLCQGNLQVSSAGDQCLSCSITNCYKCSSSLKCKACLPGFTFNLEQTACINCSLPNCRYCQGNNVCGQCYPGYQLVNFGCQLSKCKFPCAYCDSGSSDCTVCVSPPFNPTPDSNGSCYSCDASNCLNCSSLDTTVCLSCSNPFILVNGSCQPLCSQAMCLNCLNSSFCSVCSNGYSAINGTCTPCPPGCATCGSNNISQCNSCLSRFYQNGSSCVKCPSYCKLCTSGGSCQQLNNNNGGQALIQINGQVVLAKCDQGCISCANNNPSVCLQCRAGFYLNSGNGKCRPCTQSSNCKVCDGASPSTCLSCFANSFLTSSNTCSFCQFPCITCTQTNASSCLSCPRGFLLENQTCFSSQCPLFCDSCSNNTFCSQCINGFVAIDGVCTPCLAGCAQCSTVSPGLCLQCSQGTYLDPSSGSCLSCPLNCVSCLPNGCIECLYGFYLTENLTCGQNCLSPCATCSDTDPTNCLTCILGYTFNSAVLQNCEADISCNDTVSCSACPLGYALTNQMCFACNSNCARCFASSPNFCTGCLVGQYLNSTDTSAACANCPSGCQQCLSSTICLSCSDTFTSITDSSSDSPVQCAPCLAPCLTCQGSPKTCLTCQGGYSLIRQKCVSNFNFGFNVTLSVNTAAFYKNYVAFLTALSSTVGDDYGSVSIDIIKQSSTIVGGTVTTSAAPQTSTSQTQYNNLLNSLNVNGQIAGMQVLSSSVTANGGDPNSSDSGSGAEPWVIAVAVVVPLVVLVLVGIGVYCYCKKKKALNDQVEIDTSRSASSPQDQEMTSVKKSMI